MAIKTPSIPSLPEAAPRGLRDVAAAEAAAGRFLVSLHMLARTRRIYHKDHPKIEESLFAAERTLRDALSPAGPLAVRLQGGAMYLRDRPLDDPRGELRAFADELVRRGISALSFRSETHAGELMAFVEMFEAPAPAAPAAESPAWSERLAQRRVSGIRVNESVADGRPGALLPRILAAVLGHRAQLSGGEPESAGPAPLETRVLSTLKLLDGLARVLPSATDSSADPARIAGRELEGVLAAADRSSVLLLAEEMDRRPPQSGETLVIYFGRLAEEVALYQALAEYRAGRLRPAEVRHLAAEAGRQIGEMEGAHPVALAPLSRWATERGAAEFEAQFWAELSPEEISNLVRSADAWTVPAPILRMILEGATTSPALREARAALVALSKGLESQESSVRQTTAATLADLGDLLTHYWPDQLPEDFGQRIVSALVAERNPAVAALLVGVTEQMADAALHKSRFCEYEALLQAFEKAPRGIEHLGLLQRRLTEGERWEMLIRGALAHRPLDAALVRILSRAPDPLVDWLCACLGGSGAAEAGAAPLEALPAMVRLVRTIGDPALDSLARRVFDRRIGRATASVKLLAAVRPQRLLALLEQALPGWDWSVQDLAVSELSRQRLSGLAEAMLAVLPRAHVYVVPMIVDLLGMEGDPIAVPQLMEIAAAENERLRDVFLRIKAVEALGRLQAPEAAPLLRAILRSRNGLSYAEPAGLRAAAQEALDNIEGHVGQARLRKELEAAALTAGAARPRRYPRFSLGSPLTARIDGPRPATARVRVLSLGGACLESSRHLKVGDSFPVEIKSGLRSIQAMAVVRNVLSSGSGVEFVHMKQEDREKLRKLIRGLSDND
jgi:hypothetical protein